MAEKRYVRNTTDSGVFLKGHGVVPGGELVEVTGSEAVKAAVESKTFADVPKAQAEKQLRAADAGAQDNDQEGDGS